MRPAFSGSRKSARSGFASACQPAASLRSAARQHFSQVVTKPRRERRTRLPLEAVPRALLGRVGAEEADMLTSEGLKGPKRADKAAKPPC
jgi:hypothetical protein